MTPLAWFSGGVALVIEAAAIYMMWTGALTLDEIEAGIAVLVVAACWVSIRGSDGGER